MRIVIDTNLMLKMTNKKSEDHWLYKQLKEGEHTLLVTTEILHEYEEIAGKYLVDKDMVDDMMSKIIYLPKVEFIINYYKWELITVDKDDNKFVDCAISANADCIITQDGHFKVLRKIEFPKVTCYRIEEFKQLFYK